MAKQVKNDKGFLVIKTSLAELLPLTDDFGACCLCGNTEDTVYMIAAINEYYCETCYKAWYDSATRYKSDIPEETKRFNDWVAQLTDLGLWEE